MSKYNTHNSKFLVQEGNNKTIFDPKDYPFDFDVIQAQLLVRLSDKDHSFHPSDKVLCRFRLWWIQNGICFWCHKPMTFSKLPEGRIPETECTIDHLDSRNTARRGNYTHDKSARRLVGACSKCNHQRGKEEQMKVNANGGIKL